MADLQKLLDELPKDRRAMRIILEELLKSKPDMALMLCQNYLRMVYSTTIPEIQRKEVAQAFFAGMSTGFNFAVEIADYLPEDATIDAMLKVAESIEKHVKPAGRH